VKDYHPEHATAQQACTDPEVSYSQVQCSLFSELWWQKIRVCHSACMF